MCKRIYGKETCVYAFSLWLIQQSRKKDANQEPDNVEKELLKYQYLNLDENESDSIHDDQMNETNQSIQSNSSDKNKDVSDTIENETLKASYKYDPLLYQVLSEKPKYISLWICWKEPSRPDDLISKKQLLTISNYKNLPEIQNRCQPILMMNQAASPPDPEVNAKSIAFIHILLYVHSLWVLSIERRKTQSKAFMSLFSTLNRRWRISHSPFCISLSLSSQTLVAFVLLQTRPQTSPSQIPST